MKVIHLYDRQIKSNSSFTGRADTKIFAMPKAHWEQIRYLIEPKSTASQDIEGPNRATSHGHILASSDLKCDFQLTTQ
jgi:hypothetical protein